MPNIFLWTANTEASSKRAGVGVCLCALCTCNITAVRYVLASLQARGQLADALLLVPSDSCGLGWGVQPLLHALPTLLTPSAASGSSADAEAQLRLGLSAPGTAAAALADLRHRGDGPGSRVYA